MRLVHLAVAVNVCSAVVLIIAFLSWRRTLAWRALVFLTANMLLILVLADASAPLQVAAMIALAALLLYPQMHSGLHQRHLGKGWQGKPVGHDVGRLPLREPHRTRRRPKPAADRPTYLTLERNGAPGGTRRDGRGREELG
jgi:hypothetical protein